MGGTCREKLGARKKRDESEHITGYSDEGAARA